MVELDFILKHFEPVSLEYLINKPKPGKKIFHLTFDDGLKECHEIIAPILKKKGIPSTFFVNSGFVDNTSLFYKYKASLVLNKLEQESDKTVPGKLTKNILQPDNILGIKSSQESILDEAAKELDLDFSDFLNRQKPYLTTRQILELQNDGFTIGAHSINHPEFWMISEDEQLKQIKESMDWLQENIKPKIKAFAFPYTDSGASAKILKKAKEENICDITFGTAGVKYDEFDFHYQRYPMEQSGNFVSQLKSEFVYFQLRKWIGKAKVKH